METAKLPFDVEVLKKVKTAKELERTVPQILDYQQFKLHLPIPLPRAFELIVLLYSTNSPLLNSQNPKIEAARYFGYEIIDGRITDETIAELLAGDDKNFNSMVVAYCRMQKNHKFGKLVIYTDAYWANLLKLKNEDGKSGKDNEKTKEIIANIDKLDEDIDKLVSDFLNKDEGVSLKFELFTQAERVNLELRPEEVAARIAAGEQAVDVHPYGKEYNFERFGDRTKINPLNDE